MATQGADPADGPADPEALGRASRAAREAHARDAAGDPGTAAALLETAIASLGPLPVLCVPLSDLLRRLGRWEALASLCRAAAAGCGDAREAGAWQTRLAEVCEVRGDDEGAIAAYRASLAARPRDLHALAALQRLHRSQGDWPALARALEEELALRSGSEEIPLRLELAQILETRLARADDALVHLRRVLDLAPEDTRTRARALSLAASRGDAVEQVKLLEGALAQTGGAAERALLLGRQAALLAGPLASPAQAVPRWREALRLDPAVPGAREGLRSALEQLEDWPALLSCLLEESHTRGFDMRCALFERAEAIARERLGAEAALPWLERLRAERPDDAAVVARISALHRAAGRRGALVTSLEAELALGPPPERALALEREREALLGAMAPPTRRVPPDPGQDVLDGAPSNEGAPLRASLEKGRDHAPTRVGQPATSDPAAEAEAAEQELARLDPKASVFAERRRALGFTLARLYAEVLQDPERALVYLRTLVASAPAARGPAAFEAEHAWAEERLLSYLRADGSHLELAERLEVRLGRHPDDADGWLELADLREQRIFMPAAAARAYREALARGAPPARTLQGLRRASEALGDWTEVARTLEDELAQTASPSERAGLLRTLGEVAWRRLGATTRASRAFAAALEADPRDLISLRALQQLLASMEDWRGTLDLVESEIELLPAGAHEDRHELWLHCARIAAGRLGDSARAIRAFDAAAALAPLDRPARERLAECLYRCGERERFVAVATALCDEPGAEADADAELRLAAALHALDRLDAARTRCKRALARAPRLTGAWELLAEIRLAQGAQDEAAESLVRAAETTAPVAAVGYLLRAASLVEAGDLEYAHALREHACLRDAGSAAAHVGCAASALGLGRLEQAVASASRAVELALASGDDTPSLIETALCVAESARRAGLVSGAAHLLEGAASLAPDHAGVLHARADLLFELGDRRGARCAAAALLARDETHRKDARLHLIEAEGLADDAALDEAAARFAEAAQIDPSLEAAWAGLARVHQRLGQPREAIRALDALAQCSPGGGGVAHRLRAAELSLAHAEGDSAEQRLRALIRIAPGCSPAAQLLAGRLLDEARPEAALSVATDAYAHTRDAGARAALARLRARAFESLGRGSEACAAWGLVLEADAGAVDAARARAAWLRAAGSWHAAASALEDFLHAAEQTAAEQLAEVWLELAQLRAGPLDDGEGARQAYTEALRLAPGLRTAREELADLLTRNPARRSEAVAQHRALLERTPDRVASLLALTTLAAEAGQGAVAQDGHALIETLAGAGTPCHLRLRVAPAPALENPVWERARGLARGAASEISRALGASLALEPPAPVGSVEAFRLAAVVAEARLVGPALVPLRDEEAGAVVATVAALAAWRDTVSGDGHLVNALAHHFDRRARRRIRGILGDMAPEEIAGIDFRAWRAALRGLSHAVALDATGGDLPAALRALADDEDPEGSTAAHALLRRVVEVFGRAVAGEDGEMGHE